MGRGCRELRYRREFLNAIREAARPSALFKGTSLAYGLRCIRTFEKVNGIAFDPFNASHRDKVRGMAVHEAVIRRVRLQLAKGA